MEFVITIERDSESDSVSIYSEEPNIVVIRDANMSDADLLRDYAEILEDVRAHHADEAAAKA
jgi:hypothetical protein